MAIGRLIVKTYSFDERVWKQLSILARSHLPAMFPHLEGDSSLPRKARHVRLICWPLSKITDDEAESMIQEFFSTKPEPICFEKGDRIFFTDFKLCNKGLDFTRNDRQKRWREIHNKSNGSNGSDGLTPKGSEGN